MEEYFIAENEEQIGPFSIEELKGKSLTAHSLVWREGLEDWIEAKELEELKVLFRKQPPPIPRKKDEKIIQVEAKIKKEKQPLLKPETEVVVAKEIKTNSSFIVNAIIVGLISFPLWFMVNDGFANWNMITKWEHYYDKYGWEIGKDFSSDAEWLVESKKLSEQSKDLGWKKSTSAFYSNEYQTDFHNRKAKELAINAGWISALTAAVVAILLIIIRYAQKGANWVNETSKK